MEGSHGSRTGQEVRTPASRTTQAITFAVAVAIVAILAVKFALATRINVNWDEFYYLSHVYSLLRGDLHLLVQGAYTHAFRWIAGIGGDEVQQIVVLRSVMWALLVVSAWLLYRLARLWTTQPAAMMGVLAFVGSWPVMKHGASFRADSMLLPLTLASVFLALPRRASQRRNCVLAGVCLGAAIAVSLKAVLILPALMCMMFLPDAVRTNWTRPRTLDITESVLTILLIAGLTAGAVISLHGTQIASLTEPVGAFATRAVGATLIDVPFAPRGEQFLRLVAADYVFWVAIAAGLVIAVHQRAYAAAASSFALLPILFYRNAFPYYYPVMMSLPSILVAVVVGYVLKGVQLGSRPWPGYAAIAVAGVALAYAAWDSAMVLRFDGQAKQRELVAAAHRIFPEPVPYIDHSGMLATFPKANFLMSTWGVESYRQSGRDFMPAVLTESCPPLLLINHAVLKPGTLLNRQLRESDRRLLEASYVHYWGPIRVAGAELAFAPNSVSVFQVPCPGRYRVESDAQFLLRGTQYKAGDVVTLPAERDIAISATRYGRVRFVWAEARDPPEAQPPDLPVYEPL
jgi:hypothetical protein